jgi:hypothetical protein
LSGSPLTVATNGVLNLLGGGTVYLYAPLTNAGTINWSNSVTWYVYNNNNAPYNGAVYDLSGALLNIQSDRGMNPGYANPFSTTRARSAKVSARAPPLNSRSAQFFGSSGFFPLV